MPNNQLLCITGFARSGKSALIKHVSKKYGFEVVHARGVISEELRKETGRDVFSRGELRQRGREMRERLGPDYIIRLGLEQSRDRDVLFDGIRNLRAARTFMSAGGVFIGLVAGAPERFRRELDANDGKTASESVEDMVRNELPEMNSLDFNGLQLLPVLWGISPEAIIDTTHLSIDEVHKRADDLLLSYGISEPV